MHTMFVNILQLLFYIEITSISSKTEVPTELPLWTWKCDGEKCTPSRAVEYGVQQSLETCNMLCSTVQLWPHPTGHVKLGTTAVPVQADLFQLQTVTAPTKDVRQHLRDTFELFREDLQNLERNIHRLEDRHNVLVDINVKEDGDPRLRVDTDESYEIMLLQSKTAEFTLSVNITALSFCGARHALETLSQMVWYDSFARSLLILQAAEIRDAPKFHYRGLLIDTAHSYLSLGVLLRTIDAMATTKLNTFHWHVSDLQALSFHLNKVHQTAFGVFSSRDMFTVDQVRELVRKARLRGIRILIEFDVPANVGEAWSWGPSIGIGDLVHCVNNEPWTADCGKPPCGKLNPTNPHVFEILHRIYSEIIQLTGIDDVFHLGGSDISERCWVEQFNESDPTDLWIRFTRSSLQTLENVNGKLPNLTILWRSRLSERLKIDFKNYVHFIGLQVRNVAWAKKYVSGIRAVLSHEDSWDLNSGLGEWFEENGGAPYNSWQRVYEHRPWVRSGIGIVEGGEATVWSWDLSMNELDSRIWPRAAALSERLWADRQEGATRQVHARLDVLRTRLIIRGVQAAPIWSNWCTQNTHTCT